MKKENALFKSLYEFAVIHCVTQKPFISHDDSCTLNIFGIFLNQK